MKCKNLNSDLILYAENTLPAGRKARLDSHLEECSDCREFLSFIRDSLITIEKEREIRPNQFLFTRVMAGLESGKQHTKSHSKKLIPAFAFSAILVAAVIGGINLGKLYSLRSSAYSDDLKEEIGYLDDIKQEPIEIFFLTSNSESDE